MYNMDFAPDGRLAVATLAASSLTLMDPRSGATVGTLTGHTGGVNTAVGVSPYGWEAWAGA